ncbi:hypothetical protein M422DRAFT_245654 [Sphaerobolus stellatus SS14]|nr:hypothetical protein M422DRAFT_245654 [Sphaerobolus stellatus SS14]
MPGSVESATQLWIFDDRWEYCFIYDIEFENEAYIPLNVFLSKNTATLNFDRVVKAAGGDIGFLAKRSAERLSTAFSKFALNIQEIRACTRISTRLLEGSEAFDAHFHEAGFIRIITQIFKSGVDASEDPQDGFVANEMDALISIMFHIEDTEGFPWILVAFKAGLLEGLHKCTPRLNNGIDYVSIIFITLLDGILPRYLVYHDIILEMQKRFNTLDHSLMYCSAECEKAD